jgi:hypothetical protein
MKIDNGNVLEILWHNIYMAFRCQEKKISYGSENE